MKVARTILVTALVAGIAASGGVGSGHAARAAAMPRSFKFLINGRAMPIVTTTSGTDIYHPLKSGLMSLVATWRNRASAGYQVRISTTEPRELTYITCVSGTACKVPVKVPLLRSQEMSWQIDVFRPGGASPVSSYRVCLVGK